jgi:diadenosine tetraphosphate (Ap4A) HIT family hydrolase
MADVAQAVSKAFTCDKMNYELLGMGDGHLHWHLTPRRDGDLEGYGYNEKGPIWWYPLDEMYNSSNKPNDEELLQMKEKLLFELEEIKKSS